MPFHDHKQSQYNYCHWVGYIVVIAYCRERERERVRERERERDTQHTPTQKGHTCDDVIVMVACILPSSLKLSSSYRETKTKESSNV